MASENSDLLHSDGDNVMPSDTTQSGAVIQIAPVSYLRNKVPPEIRLMIFEHLLVSNQPHTAAFLQLFTGSYIAAVNTKNGFLRHDHAKPEQSEQASTKDPIDHFLLSAGGPLYGYSDVLDNYGVHPQILATCRLFHDEGLPILYSNATFKIEQVFRQTLMDVVESEWFPRAVTYSMQKPLTPNFESFVTRVNISTMMHIPPHRLDLPSEWLTCLFPALKVIGVTTNRNKARIEVWFYQGACLRYYNGSTYWDWLFDNAFPSQQIEGIIPRFKCPFFSTSLFASESDEHREFIQAIAKRLQGYVPRTFECHHQIMADLKKAISKNDFFKDRKVGWNFQTVACDYRTSLPKVWVGMILDRDSEEPTCEVIGGLPNDTK
ncbi:hypothetical protein BT63DRAFT_460239 [Microthyrium microscopicum]|uniref:Uncharacterized protein n=1 Tax=Microthyrium microscopicum TaxID=703497 RepID=A0A6A6TZZ8_9PEZI|nr:hypothetical protein BT63DRAFT_460239 [Microthyrium microscopicum]